MDEDICLIIYYTQLQKSIPHNKWKYLVCRRIVTVKLNIYIIYTHHLALHRHLLIWLAQDWDIRLQNVHSKHREMGEREVPSPALWPAVSPLSCSERYPSIPAPPRTQPVPPWPPPCSLQSSSLWWSSLQRLNTVPSTHSPSIYISHSLHWHYP